MKIKAIFPGFTYSSRQIKILDENNKVIGYLSPGVEWVLDQVPEKLKFKLDYHTVTVDNPKEDDNLIVYFNHRNSFPLNFFDLMFKNAMRFKIVNNEDWEKGVVFYGAPDKRNTMKKPITYLRFLFILAPLLSLLALYFYPGYFKSAHRFLLVLNIAVLLGNVFTSLKSNENQQQLKIKTIANFFLNMYMLVYVEFPLSLVYLTLMVLFLYFYFVLIHKPKELEFN